MNANETASMTLTEFLLTRIDEDERRRLAFWHDLECPTAHDAGAACACGSQARIAAECEAKRRIVKMLSGSPDFYDAMPREGYAEPYHSPSLDVLVRVQQLLALPYADHPDYRQEWKP